MPHPLVRGISALLALGGTIAGGGLPAQAEVFVEAATPGRLALAPNSFTVLQTTVPATVKIRTDIPVHLQVTPPVLRFGVSPDPSDTVKRTVMRLNTTQVASDDPIPHLNLPIGLNEVALSMQVQRSTYFLAGDYLYEVSLTVTP
ncbi:hypothetical protein [Trichothermofontia sp.]